MDGANDLRLFALLFRLHFFLHTLLVHRLVTLTVSLVVLIYFNAVRQRVSRFLGRYRVYLRRLLFLHVIRKMLFRRPFHRTLNASFQFKRFVAITNVLYRYRTARRRNNRPCRGCSFRRFSLFLVGALY